MQDVLDLLRGRLPADLSKIPWVFSRPLSGVAGE